MANEEPTDLDWIQLRREMGPAHHIETSKEKFVRKFGENPFVPIGIIIFLYYFKHLLFLFSRDTLVNWRSWK